MNSFAMMLFAWLLVCRISRPLARTSLLAFTGVLFLFFHVLHGVYFRFFNVHLPVDVFRQWSDIFVVGGDGVALLSLPETLLVFLLPAALMVTAIRKPVKAKWPVFAVLALVIGFGWTHRLNRNVERPSAQMAALPAYIHRVSDICYTVGLGGKRFQTLSEQADTLIPIDTSRYERRSGEAFMQTPLRKSSPDEVKPYNIIIILAESLRAYECGFLGAQPGVTPYLDRLTESGSVYTNFYANGSQTARGELSMLCSIYDNPYGTPTYLVNPLLNVISLPEILKSYGYTTHWLSGYTANFHNKRTFLTKHGVDHIIDREVLPEAQDIVGWGMSDVEMFNHAYHLVHTFDSPFFLQITTLSNHYGSDDFPVQMDTPKTPDARYQRYLEGTAYTDAAIGQFLDKFFASELSRKTIVVVTGDHGLWLFPHEVKDYFQRIIMYFQSPLCIWGPDDVVTPGQYDTIGSHVDIAPTLLNMLNIRSCNTFFGRSLQDDTIDNDRRFAFCLMGAAPFFRQGDHYVISNIDAKQMQNICFMAERMNNHHRNSNYTALTATGDILRGNYHVGECDSDTAATLSAWADALKFISGYSIYFDKFVAKAGG